MEALTMDQIADLLAGSRQRGQYEGTLKEFASSEKPGIEISLTEGAYVGKNAQTVYAGFNSKVGEDTDFPNVKVINREGHIFLLNLTLVNAQAASETSEVEPVTA